MDNYLKKQNVLQKTNNGEDLFRYILQQYGLQFQLGKTIKNPFYADTKPSLSFYTDNNGQIRFNDFGNPDYKGNCFDFARFFYKMNISTKEGFYDLLKRLNQDMRLELVEYQQKEQKHFRNVSCKEFTDSELMYWSQFGITDIVLKQYGVCSIEFYTIKSQQYYTKQNSFVFGYKVTENCYKIYKPLDKKYKFFWVGSKPKDYIFGLEQLSPSADILFITGGEKDVMTLRTLGYDAITLNSETAASIPEELLNELRSRFELIFVLYDIDDTGKNQSEVLVNEYNLKRIELPKVPDSVCKDISDLAAYYHENPENPYFTNEIFAKLIKDNQEEQLFSKLYFPKEIYDKLPEFLQDVLRPFVSSEQKDIILLSALAVLSSVFNNVSGIYDGQRIFPNLNIFIIGEASSGKGIVSNVKNLGIYIHNHLTQKSKNENKEANKVKKKGDKETPIKWQLFFLPANSTASGIYELLYNNNGCGIIFETEGETLTNSFDTNISNFRDLLRKAAHHEPVSSYRKSEKEYFNIDLPKLSCILTGTPNQAIALIQSSEDGTFSRFIYYTISSNIEFRNVFQNKDTDYSIHFKKFGKIVFDKYFHGNENIERRFSFSQLQEEQFVSKMDEIQYRLVYEHGESLSQIAKRMGLYLYRIAMILSILEDDLKSTEIKCSDNNFQIITQMGNTLINHLPFVLKIIPQHVTKLRTNIEVRLFGKLPEEFERKEVKCIVDELKVSLRTLDRLLANENLFEKLGHGNYRKKK